jgi:hypothetical protein
MSLSWAGSLIIKKAAFLTVEASVYRCRNCRIGPDVQKFIVIVIGDGIPWINNGGKITNYNLFIGSQACNERRAAVGFVEALPRSTSEPDAVDDNICQEIKLLTY